MKVDVLKPKLRLSYRKVPLPDHSWLPDQNMKKCLSLRSTHSIDNLNPVQGRVAQLVFYKKLCKPLRKELLKFL
jgi:hypothetical protein